MTQSGALDGAGPDPVELVENQLLTAEQRHLFDHAKSAIKSGNRSYGAAMLLRLLDEVPGCDEARRYLLAMLHERGIGRQSPVQRVFAALSTGYRVLVSGPRALKRGDVTGALRVADHALCRSPASRAVLIFVYRACMAGGFADTGAAALELCHLAYPADLPVLLFLRDHYRNVGDHTRESAVIQKMCELRPNDLQLQSELKQSVARATIKRDKWEEATTFRDLIRDSEEAQLLEKQLIRGGRDEATVDELLSVALTKLAERETPSQHREVGDLLLQKKDFPTAIEHFQRAYEMTGQQDPGLLDRVIAAWDLQFKHALARWREAGTKNAAFREESVQRIAEIEAQRHHTLLTLYTDRQNRFPHETRYHFELGEMLFISEDYDAALRRFQEASGNPAYRTRALVYIGKCLWKKGMTDLAVEQLEKALDTRSDRMDAERKDILYTLALLHLGGSQREKALPLLKEIYAVDAGYRDVGQYIQHFYAIAAR